MRHLDARLGDERVEAGGDLVDGEDAVVEEECLASARQLASDRGADGLVGVAASDR